VPVALSGAPGDTGDTGDTGDPGRRRFDEMSYGEWEDRSNAVARGLGAAGVERGDRVALFVGNDCAALYQIGYFAVLKAGAVAVPINPGWRAGSSSTWCPTAGPRPWWPGRASWNASGRCRP